MGENGIGEVTGKEKVARNQLEMGKFPRPNPLPNPALKRTPPLPDLQFHQAELVRSRPLFAPSLLRVSPTLNWQRTRQRRRAALQNRRVVSAPARCLGLCAPVPLWFTIEARPQSKLTADCADSADNGGVGYGDSLHPRNLRSRFQASKNAISPPFPVTKLAFCLRRCR